jgi:cytosine/adenosine deaminase-related metal-dependent hydrolase
MDAPTEREACDGVVVANLAVTMEDANLLVPDAAIAVGANRILMVGAARDVFGRCRSHVRIGAVRHVAVPGLVNTHNHTPMVVRGMLEDMTLAPAYTAGVLQGNDLAEEEAYRAWPAGRDRRNRAPGTIVRGAQGATVDTVMVDGRIVLEHGHPISFDGEEVLRPANAVTLELWRRIGHAPKALVA